MDYTKIPRDLIYRERRSLEEFAEEQEENVLFIDNMLDSYYFSSADGKERALRCFNTAYYLCTLILLSDKHPDWNFSLYCDIAYCGDRINKVHQSFTLSLVYIFLTHTYYEVPCKKFLDKLDIFFVNYKNALVKNDPFLKDYTYKDVCNDLLKNTPDDLLIAEEFKPRVIDRECIDDVMSDREFNWVKFTNYWKERNVREIVGALGITEDEKHNVVEMLRQSSHGFYSAGCNDNPEQVDAMLNNIDEEIRLQFNPEAGQNIEDDDSEQDDYMELKPWEEAYPEMLRNENARLRDEIDLIKDFLKGAVTYDKVNEVLNISELGIGVENAKKIVADAIARAEGGDLFVHQTKSKGEEEKVSNNQREAEEEKDRLITELREENHRLVNEVNRLKMENDEFRKKISEGGEAEWIGCFDVFLHSSLNPQAIAKALEGITHSYFPKHERGFWWVFNTVLTEINWIPRTNYKLALQWANLHFNCGWDWKKDNQFKFSDINDKIKSIQPSSKWNKSVTGNVIGDYYGELAKTMKETFVTVVEGNKLLDKKEFILPGCPLINNGRK